MHDRTEIVRSTAQVNQPLLHTSPESELATSMSLDFIVSVDVGTTSTRAIAFTKTAEIIAQHQVEYDQSESWDREEVFAQRAKVLDPRLQYSPILDGTNKGWKTSWKPFGPV